MKAKSFVDNNEAAMLSIAHKFASKGKTGGVLFSLQARTCQMNRPNIWECKLSDTGWSWDTYDGATELFRINCVAIISRDIFVGHSITDEYDSHKEKWIVKLEFNFLPFAI